MSNFIDFPRRRLLSAILATGSLGLTGLPRIVQALTLTPRQSSGPFYPEELPLDDDNDLVKVAGQRGVAQGRITHLFGRVIDERGRPVEQARVEIWQCNAYGRYHHPRDRRNVPLDPNFQGHGQFITQADGAYRFRTIKPVAYPGRAPHIHFAISGPGFEPLVTQMFVAGAPENAGDYLFNSIQDPAAQSSVLVAFEPSHTATELQGRFDIVLAGNGQFGR
ncbi:MAG: intradiol ring-cleavage dioxygenase [Gammaproteobacteria bacterium]|nr:intradiol ring-cleavage dioxygenase [Gammaproteobacteria bacterium]MCP5458629.1 intradiol ring-cleavage dioxygenase [Gammaproteobacteria bacterium]